MRGEYCLVKKNRSNGIPAWTVGRATGNAMFETSVCSANLSTLVFFLNTSYRGIQSELGFLLRD